jgi:hypothetical protein
MFRLIAYRNSENAVYRKDDILHAALINTALIPSTTLSFIYIGLSPFLRQNHSPTPTIISPSSRRIAVKIRLTADLLSQINMQRCAYKDMHT